MPHLRLRVNNIPYRSVQFSFGSLIKPIASEDENRLQWDLSMFLASNPPTDSSTFTDQTIPEHQETFLSLIIPAYNEASRLPSYLDSVRSYLSETLKERYELIVVDDGSKDGTNMLLKELCKDWPQLQIVHHSSNQGKGAAIRTGMLVSHGKLLLFADADGATPIEEESKLRNAIEMGAIIAVGSRMITSQDVHRQRNFCRDLASTAFSWLVNVFFKLGIRDTQCGFKMFRREQGMELFRICQRDDYLFDIEILTLARQRRYPIAEVPVSWCEVAGSKLSLRKDGWKMCSGLWGLRKRLRFKAADAANSIVYRDAR